MTDDFFQSIEGKQEIKDPKGSVRRKYQTRLRHLAYTLDDFITHAEQRLDAVKAGKIHQRTETEKLLESCKTLRAAIPIKNIAEEELSPEIYRNLCDIFGLDAELDEDQSK